MIKTFKHKGLKAFFATGSKKGIQPKHERRLQEQLAIINVATVVDDVDWPGYDLHQLKGDRSEWSIKVNGNWRLTFEFIDGDAYILNYEDYH